MSYATTNPQSGTQDLTHNESAPHSSVETQARRDDAFVGQAKDHHHHHHHHHNDNQTGALNNTNTSSQSYDLGAGLALGAPLGGTGSQSYSDDISRTYVSQSGPTGTSASSRHDAESSAYSSSTNDRTSNQSGGNRVGNDPSLQENIERDSEKIKQNITPTDPSRQNDKTYAGFDPKGNTHDDRLDNSVENPQEVEHISTDGPHGLVWQESTGKYVHRRELEGKNSI